jgi:uncharacterized protein Yka (UPF0111/DUF47 family)
MQANKKIDEISAQFKKELAEMAALVVAKTEEFSQVAGDITKLEKEADGLRADVEALPSPEKRPSGLAQPRILRRGVQV